ncbi:MAG: hypothetical protein AAGI66_06215 [Cyanobacteria bacterium P01_H01_bin.74]
MNDQDAFIVKIFGNTVEKIVNQLKIILKKVEEPTFAGKNRGRFKKVGPLLTENYY